MLKLNWDQHQRLVREISNSPDGDWTHIVRGKPARYENRVISCGNVTVFFRGEDFVGRWAASAWDKEARKIIPEQLTLF